MMFNLNFGLPRCALLLLLAYPLAGCSLPVSAPQHIQPAEGRQVMQTAVRVIIKFKRPTEDNAQLSAAIAEACHCQPVFFRPFPGNALIYEIALPQGHAYADFEKALLLNAARFGIDSVEQDRIVKLQ